jgi:two-component system sensor histidine kinase KdpD
MLSALGQVLRAAVHRRASPRQGDDDARDALVRALCHDMHGPLAALAGALDQLAGEDAGRGDPRGGAPADPRDGLRADLRADLLSLAEAQTAQLSSMLRTVEASDATPARRALWQRPLRQVVAASVAAAGLPRSQLTVRIEPDAADVSVGDARLQRILWNLLENAHRHGAGAPVSLVAVRRTGWVEIALTQAGLLPSGVVDHLAAARPPAGLTGLGLWSVRRQTRELGGLVLWDDDGSALTLRVVLPDR